MQIEDHLPDELKPVVIARGRRLLDALEMRFISCVYWRNRAPWSVPWRHVGNSLLLAPVRGAVRVELESLTRNVHPGEALMIPEYTRHRLTLPPRRAALDQIALHADLHVSGRPLFSLLARPVVRLPAGVDWHAQLRRLICAAARDPAAAETRGGLLIHLLLMALVDDGLPLAPPAPDMDSRMAAALHTIRERYGEDLSVSGLAAAAGLSEVQFRKLFRRAAGATPRRYLVNHRLERAARLLTTTTLPVKDIAYRVGFHSDHFFHRTFKNAFGCTPTVYRRRQSTATRL